jgi:hypothetical protein
VHVSRFVGPVIALTVVAAGLVIPPAAAAQDARGYVGGGAAITPWSPESNSSGASLSFDNTSDDNWAPAVQLEAGVFVSRHVGLGLEFALPARRAVDQTYGYALLGYRAEIRYREAPLFAVLRLHPTGRPPGLSFVAGAGMVHQDGFERRASRIGLTTAYGPFGPETRTSRRTWGATAGLDAVLPLGSRVRLVPQIRAVYVERGETFEADEFADLGVRAVSYRLALTLRAHF